MITVVGAAFMSTGTVLLYCWMGSFTTNQFFRFTDASYESMWYKFPVDLRKYLRLIIINAQRPRVYHGFRFIDLSLVTFVTVWKLMRSHFIDEILLFFHSFRWWKRSSLTIWCSKVWRKKIEKINLVTPQNEIHRWMENNAFELNWHWVVSCVWNTLIIMDCFKIIAFIK